ncbi:MAG TPA: hypothetical protein VGK17_10345 [Propionicimonas sp.]
MNILVRIVADAFQAFDIPVKTVQRTAAYVLLIAAIFFPAAFAKGLITYAEAQSTQWEQSLLRPMLDHLQAQLPTPTATSTGR